MISLNNNDDVDYFDINDTGDDYVRWLWKAVVAICETSWKCRATKLGPIGATTITSARSSGTDMTGSSTVLLQSGGAACQCYTDTTVYQLLQTEQAVQTRIWCL